MPLMFVVMVLAARWVVRRFSLPIGFGSWFGVELAALGLLVCTELTVGFWLRGLTLNQYLRTWDAVAGSAYLVMLVVFAMMPLSVARR